MCKDKRKKTALVVPFVPNVVDPKGAALMESLTHMEHDVPKREGRTTLASFKGRCSHHTRNPSRLLRSHVVAAFADAGDQFDVSHTSSPSHRYWLAFSGIAIKRYLCPTLRARCSRALPPIVASGGHGSARKVINCSWALAGQMRGEGANWAAAFREAAGPDGAKLVLPGAP